MFTQRGKEKVMDMLYKYKEAFSLRDETGTCPNIEIEIIVTDRSLFFIRPYHVREEDETFSPYSSPVMLISQKVMQDKEVLTDFRHLNVRIVKNNLAYPLVRDTFSVLGNSK